MKYFFTMVIISLMLMFMPISYIHSQSDSGWQLQSTDFVPYLLGGRYQISSQGTYLVQGDIGPEFINVNNVSREYESFHYLGFLPRWLNETMIYREYEREGWGDPPECTMPDTATFGFYDAVSKSNQLFCLTPPASYVMQEEIYPYDSLERSPFDNYTVLINDRFLVNLQTQEWQDLQGTFPINVSLSDILGWSAYGETWWNPDTQKPMARIRHIYDATADGSTVTSETISICPMENDYCQTIISVQDYVHGRADDVIVLPDGQSLLWSSLIIKASATIGRPGDGPFQDVIGYSTDLQSGVTTEIFRLSEHNTRKAVGRHAQWSEDGTTLAIDMEAVDTQFPASSPDNGLILAQFTRKA